MQPITCFLTVLFISISCSLAQEQRFGGFIEDMLKNLFQERDVENQKEPFSGRDRGTAGSNRQRRQCSKLPDPGRCESRELMFYFDPFYGQCLQFMYTGCGGNRNRFETLSECNKYCNNPIDFQDGFIQSDAPRARDRNRSARRGPQSDSPRGGFLSQGGPDGGGLFDMKKLQGFGQLGVGFLRALRTPGPYRGSFGICTPETCPQFYERVDKFKDNLDDRLLDIETAGEISKKEGGTEFLREIVKGRRNDRRGGQSETRTPKTREGIVAKAKTDDYYDEYDS